MRNITTHPPEHIQLLSDGDDLLSVVPRISKEKDR